MAYADEVLADGPVGYWKLKEAAGTTITDSSGNSLTGTFNGTIATGNPLANGATAIDFNGSSHNVTVTDTAALRFTGSCSLECWVRQDGTAGTQDIITKSVFGASGTGYGLYFFGFAPIFEFYRAGSTGDTCTANGTPGVYRGMVAHLVGVYDSVAQTMKLYTNGVLSATTSSIVAPLSNVWGRSLNA